MKFLLMAVLMVLFGVVVAAYNVWNQPPKVLSMPIVSWEKSERLAQNLWSPQEVKAAANMPDITAKAAFFVDVETGKVLYSKDEHQRLPIASLTKIMTVIVAMEHRKMSEVFTISETAAAMEPDHMMLIAGEKLTLEELLDGVFLVSGNDAAEAIAENTTGRREEFINLMNSKAKMLGMNDTVFINPSGLEEDGRTQYSSAYDVALMSRYAIAQFPELINISSQYHIYLPVTPTHQDYDMYSGINLLTTYPGVIGFKTGYTPEAGLTLVTLARKNGHEVIGVLLGSEDRRAEARTLLDYSFEQLGVEK